MEVTRTMQALLNVSAEELFQPSTTSPDYMRIVILEQLRERYVGRCKGGCLIKSISDIVRRSEARMVKDRLDGSADICVQFVAVGHMLTDGDLIVGAQVIRKEGNNAIFQSESIVADVTHPSLINKISLGQSLPLQVEDAKHLDGKPMIAVKASVYQTPYEVRLYQIRPPEGPAPPDLLDTLRGVIRVLGQARSDYEAAPAKRRDYFRQMYYPYEEPVTASQLPKGVKPIRILDLAAHLLDGKANPIPEQATLLMHPMIPRDSGEIYLIGDGVIEIREGDIPKVTGPEVFDFDKLHRHYVAVRSLVRTVETLAIQQARYLRMLADMARYYESKEVFEAHRNIWTRYDIKARLGNKK
jgi:hypothetical protein